MLATSKNRQSGIVDALIIYAAGGAVILGLLTGLYLTGRSHGKASKQADWDKEKAAIILVQEAKKKETVALVTKLVTEGIEKDAAISAMAANIKAKGISNETKTLCPNAPDGSALVTPERLRALKQLYSK